LKTQGAQANPEAVRRTLKRLGRETQGGRFQRIKRLTEKAVKSENSVLSTDTKKKEVLGAYKNGGKERREKEGSPRRRLRHCLPTRMAEGGGSQSICGRRWKYEPRLLSDEIGVSIRVYQYPPGASWRDKIEHGLFSFASMNWRGSLLAGFKPWWI
jgi:hypothetical protein